MGKHIWIADSLTGSFGIALMLEKSIEFAKTGKSAEEIFKSIDKNGLRIFSIFISSDLHFMMRSGRITALTAGVGSLLKLVPIITTNEEGKLKTYAKCIDKKRLLKLLKTSHY